MWVWVRCLGHKYNAKFQQLYYNSPEKKSKKPRKQKINRNAGEIEMNVGCKRRGLSQGLECGLVEQRCLGSLVLSAVQRP